MTKFFNKKIERPLSNVHWSVLALLIAVYIIHLLASTCDTKPDVFIWVLLTATILIILWVRHLVFYPINSRAVFLKYISSVLLDIFLFFLWLIITLIPFAILMPAYQCYTPRTKISEMLILSATLRPEIEAKILKNHSLQGAGLNLSFSLEPTKYLGYSMVTSEGAIILVGKDPIGVIVLTPSLSNEKVSWQCIGYPKEIMPAECRK